MTLSEEFTAHREHLRAVALRMLGRAADADDALQEAWLRIARGTQEIRNTRAFLTTVVARVCLDMLRQRAARREVALEAATGSDDPRPEDEVALADAVGQAMLIVLDTLTPAERVALVLHDVFAVPFEQIAVVLDRSVPAAKMLASRARRRVREARLPLDTAGQRRIVAAFLAASRDGDFAALLELLAPDVVARAGRIEVRGAQNVAKQANLFSRHADAARIEEHDGSPAIVAGATILRFTFDGDRITHITITAS